MNALNSGTRSLGDPWFALKSAREKVRALPEAIGRAMNQTNPLGLFELGRDAKVVSPAELPPKPGLSAKEGQARLLHDLASIELQAMELAARTLFEFPDAPAEFRTELAEVALSESRHLTLCLDSLEGLGWSWGDWNVHLALWNTVAADDSLLDRVLIVHRYLEGSGLDAGDSILRRLSGVAEKTVRSTVQTIVDEEVGHVLFGSRWYRKIAEMSKIDPERDFSSRIGRIAELAPRRERLARELRKLAGFSDYELQELERIEAGIHGVRR